jgi:hypothetical protein
MISDTIRNTKTLFPVYKEYNRTSGEKNFPKKSDTGWWEYHALGEQHMYKNGTADYGNCDKSKEEEVRHGGDRAGTPQG